VIDSVRGKHSFEVGRSPDGGERTGKFRLSHVRIVSFWQSTVMMRTAAPAELPVGNELVSPKVVFL